MGIKFLLFLPFLEIIFFIFFGDVLGFLNTLLVVILTGFLGLYLVFRSGKYENFKEIGQHPIDWIAKKIAGILLLIPGFLTDLLGFLLLVKPIRNILWSFIPINLKKYSDHFKKKHNSNMKNDNNIIDADYKNLDD